MSVVIKVEVDESLRRWVAATADYPRARGIAIAEGMDRAGELVLGKVTRERFTGHGPFPVEEHRLGVRTNRLRQSLRWLSAEPTGDQVTGAMGSNVEYFAANEWGFDGDVEVKAFTRTVSPTQFVKPGGGLKKLPKTKKARANALGTEEVKAHTRHLHIPARGSMGHGIADHIGDFTRLIGESLRGLWISMAKGGA